MGVKARHRVSCIRYPEGRLTMLRVARAEPRRPADYGPFMPGAGSLPPYLAGRVREQTKIESILDILRRGKPPPSALIFFGPRGNGKTALLNWTRLQALKRRIKVISIGTAEVRTEESLLNQLSSDTWWTGLIEAVSWQGAEVRLRRSGASATTKALARLARRAPTILLIDEAHTLDAKVGGLLLQGAQTVALEGGPLLLILAGTPNLKKNLRRIHATFWERSAIHPLRRLDQTASSEAIRIPFQQAGKEIAADALESVVADSQGYPFFLQLWGKELWDQVCQSSRPIGTADVNRVRPDLEFTRNSFYLERYCELDDSGLVAPAVALAEAYAGIESLDKTKVDEVLKAAIEADGQTVTSERLMQVREELHNLGYVWSPGGARKDLYFCGIPSLMSFVVDAAGG